MAFTSINIIGTATLLAFVFSCDVALAKDDGAAARAEFEVAARYFDAEEYEAALPHFAAAYALSAHRPATIFGLAQCERSLKRYDEAIEHFREYATVISDPDKVREIKETIGLLEELRSTPIAAPPAGATPPAIAAPPAGVTPPAIALPPAIAPPVIALPPVRKDSPDPIPQPAAIQSDARSEDGEDGLLASPLFWIAAAAVIAGGAAAAALTLGGSADPYGGNRGVVLEPKE